MNSFTTLSWNAYAYYNAAALLYRENKKSDNEFKSEADSGANSITTMCAVNKPRDHLFAIAVELMGKAVINEYEILLDPEQVPRVDKYKHKFHKIHAKVKKITEQYPNDIAIKFDPEQALLEKLAEIISWGSRYHYGGNPEDHLRKVCDGPHKFNKKANPNLSDKEIQSIVTLFRKYDEIYRFLFSVR